MWQYQPNSLKNYNQLLEKSLLQRWLTQFDSLYCEYRKWGFMVSFVNTTHFEVTIHIKKYYPNSYSLLLTERMTACLWNTSSNAVEKKHTHRRCTCFRCKKRKEKTPRSNSAHNKLCHPSTPSECQQDMSIPSIVFITLQLPNMFLPFTDLRLWKGEPFKCFPFKSNAYAVFTPKTLPSPHNQSRLPSAHHRKAFPVIQQHKVSYWRWHKVTSGILCLSFFFSLFCHKRKK